MTLGILLSFNYFQIINVPEVRVCDNEVSNILQIQNIKVGLKIYIIKGDGASATSGFSEEHPHGKVSVWDIPWEISCGDVFKNHIEGPSRNVSKDIKKH